ncbi:MAG TPA: hypothetical protein VFO66_09005 [Gemmatimonadaceae bacterium]|nr:hypothetical protein [Gemmatimonadaceae bacterium]
MTLLRACAALLVLGTACARTDSPAGDTMATTGGTDRVATAARVSNAIAANPAGADSILQANGMTADEFQRLMYEIARDSSQSAAYAAAKKM